MFARLPAAFPTFVMQTVSIDRIDVTIKESAAWPNN
jgi:hypothetical protein